VVDDPSSGNFKQLRETASGPHGIRGRIAATLVTGSRWIESLDRYGPLTRRPVSEVAFADRWGERWLGWWMARPSKCRRESSQ